MTNEKLILVFALVSFIMLIFTILAQVMNICCGC